MWISYKKNNGSVVNINLARVDSIVMYNNEDNKCINFNFEGYTEWCKCGDPDKDYGLTEYPGDYLSQEQFDALWEICVHMPGGEDQ